MECEDGCDGQQLGTDHRDVGRVGLSAVLPFGRLSPPGGPGPAALHRPDSLAGRQHGVAVGAQRQAGECGDILPTDSSRGCALGRA